MGLFSGGGFGDIASGLGVGGLLGGGMGASLGGLMGGGMLGSLNPDATLQKDFQPFNVQGPFGGMTFDPETRQINLGLSGESQLTSDMLTQAMAGGPFGQTQLQQLFGQQGNMLGQQALGLGGMSGMFGRGLGMQAAGAGQNFLGAANAANPQDIAQGQFDRMQALLAPRRERAQLGLESRLLRQGLLGSTAGGEQFRGMHEANAMQDAGIAESALREGLNTQQGLFGMGLQGLQAGQGLFGAGTGQQLGGMQSGLGMMGTGVNMEQQGLANFLNMMNARSGLGQNLLGQANIGMGAGANQSNIDAANAAAQTSADARTSDMISGLLGSGLQMAAMGGA